MSRYIDADLAQKKIAELCEKYNVAYGSKYEGEGFGKALSEVTNEVPALNVQEIRHSKWIEERLPNNESISNVQNAVPNFRPKKPKREPEPYQKHFLEGVDGFYCPVCERDLIDNDNDCFEFCPDCGQAIDWSEEDSGT